MPRQASKKLIFSGGGICFPGGAFFQGLRHPLRPSVSLPLLNPNAPFRPQFSRLKSRLIVPIVWITNLSDDFFSEKKKGLNQIQGGLNMLKIYPRLTPAKCYLYFVIFGSKGKRGQVWRQDGSVFRTKTCRGCQRKVWFSEKRGRRDGDIGHQRWWDKISLSFPINCHNLIQIQL